jgi:type I restriction enzyme, S subunit
MNAGLPLGWSTVALEEIASPRKGKKPRVEMYAPTKGFVPYLDIRAIEKGVISTYAEATSSRLGTSRDLFVVWDGARSGWVALGQEGAVGSTIMALEPKGGDRDYLYRWLQTQFEHINTNARGTGIPHVDPEIFWNLEIPFAPLEEQRRIVAKLEKLLGSVAASQQRLMKVPILLKRFRQSVLAAACSGYLTADWRESHSTVEAARVTASLQENIDIPDLPETWIAGALSDCCERIIDGNYGADYPKKVEFLDSGIPFFTSAAIGEDGNLIEQEVKFISPEKHAILRKAQTTVGDVIFTNRGARVGATAMLLDSRFSVSNIGPQVTRLASSPTILSPRYLFFWMRSPFFLKVMRERNGGSAMNFLNLTVTKALPIFLPPLAEQQEIVHRVERLFALADQIEARYARAKAHVEKLTQSILGKAFRGELVPQDPNDEPASVLLERIRAQRNGQPSGKGKTGAK